jgi:hypothetical protein
VLLDTVRFLLAGQDVGGENQVMPRTLRASAGGYFHALNRGNKRSRVFHDAGTVAIIIVAEFRPSTLLVNRIFPALFTSALENCGVGHAMSTL